MCIHAAHLRREEFHHVPSAEFVYPDGRVHGRVVVLLVEQTPQHYTEHRLVKPVTESVNVDRTTRETRSRWRHTLFLHCACAPHLHERLCDVI